MNASRIILAVLVVSIMALMTFTGPAQALDEEYRDVVIQPNDYEYYFMWELFGTGDDKIDIEVVLNSGPGCRIWVTRGSFYSEDDAEVKVNKTISTAGEKVKFTFDPPDDDLYNLYIFNDHETQSINIDVSYSDDDAEEAAAAITTCIVIIIVGVIVLIVIIVVIVKVVSKKKEQPPPPPGGYPPPQQGGYPPAGQQQGGYPPPQQGGYPPPGQQPPPPGY